mmetsp:Transcript_137234/g.382808  ORF Transcript_137234/g.382808 Transcript_137234/m.382808 type:complete len:237 (+) Transcript_137234:48-758(+)
MPSDGRVADIVKVGLLFVVASFLPRWQFQLLRQEIARLTDESPCARVFVTSVEKDPDTRIAKVSMIWVDTNDKWEPRRAGKPKRLTVYGQDVYFDSYQIIFDADRVRRGDPLRGRALTLFARTFGSHQSPAQGSPINMPASVLGMDGTQGSGGKAPATYQLRHHGPSSWIERLLWAPFWFFCSHPGLAKRYGIRVVQGTAVHKSLQPGCEYRLSITNQGQILLDGPLSQGSGPICF